MTITAGMVKELRERTGSGMMECKKALVETNGDIEAAIESMRKSGQAKAAKKAGRIAAEGLVLIKQEGSRAVLVEVNCETDFVAKDANFGAFADGVAVQVLAGGAADVEALLDQPLAGGSGSVKDGREALIAKLGENINVRRFERLDAGEGALFSYRHGTRIGVVLEVAGGSEALGKDLAMHIAASNPVCVAEADVPVADLEKEKDIFKAQALESGKPANIVDKMVEGRIRKYLEEVTLVGQPFVKDPETRVGDLLKQAGARVVRFKRYELGEGIEKKESNFAEEVAAQVRSAD